MEKRISVRLKTEDRKLLEEMAKNGKATISEVIRQLLLKGYVRDDKPLMLGIKELNKVGVNLNQIAKKLNSGERENPENVLEELRKILQEIREKI